MAGTMATISSMIVGMSATTLVMIGPTVALISTAALADATRAILPATIVTIFTLAGSRESLNRFPVGVCSDINQYSCHWYIKVFRISDVSIFEIKKRIVIANISTSENNARVDSALLLNNDLTINRM